ncbi:MAG: 2-aminoethylphosphonate--pyruvate transaminase [Deltaproteobacteria bacterium]|nr:2-aminoethylphosphonate--pyruvate transaminase [Deltaproteobacteria bacterium]
MQRANDKILFTPGPLTTSHTVKQAMLRDLGSRDFEFIRTVQEVRDGLLEIAGVTVTDKGKQRYDAIPVQGSGTFAIEAVLSSTIPRDGKILVLVNGAYGKRILEIASTLGIEHQAIVVPENEALDTRALEAVLLKDDQAAKKITHVAVVHCETTTGIMNPVEEIGRVVKRFARVYFVDAMSSFGAVPLNIEKAGIDYLVSSANKCIEGVPGFAFVLASRDAIIRTEGYARSVSLNLLAQLNGLENNGQFRFTPPTHALLAFRQALRELEEEGGVAGRNKRYTFNQTTLVQGMRELGFKEYLKPSDQGVIITSFCFPTHTNFAFNMFYEKLSEKGYVIYPGKVSNADCFRIGSIGRIDQAEIKALLRAVKETLAEMNITLTTH